MKKVLVAGGAGYIGSHTAVELCKAGFDVVCGDNYVNSSEDVFERLQKITGKDIEKYHIDFCDSKAVAELFEAESFDAVIHFAGLKAVGESVEKPFEYYENNISSALNVARACVNSGVKTFIFSSSATVYGEPEFLPYTEEHPLTFATNPYGNSKLFIEKILEDIHAAYPELNVVLLRYFNPVGAHKSGLIGENPRGIPNNLMPYLCQVASGQREKLSIFGNDYDTPDGTCLRDFIHVVDLAKGHIAALDKVEKQSGIYRYNLGTGNPTSVLELVRKFEEVNKVPVPFEFTQRRAGDLPVCYADAQLAWKELGWKAELNLEDMVRDSWRWQSSLT